MARRNRNLSSPVRRALAVSIPAVIGLGFKIAAAFQDSSGLGLDAISVIGSTLLIGAALVILVMVWSDGARHASRFAVRRRRPATLLLTGRWTRHLVEGLGFAGFTPPPRYLGFYVLSVEESGLGFWHGVFRVRTFSFIPWNRIDSIQLGLDKDSEGELEVVQLVLNRQGPGTIITLAVSRSPWQAGVARSSELADISLDLRSRLEISHSLS